MNTDIPFSQIGAKYTFALEIPREYKPSPPAPPPHPRSPLAALLEVVSLRQRHVSGHAAGDRTYGSAPRHTVTPPRRRRTTTVSTASTPRHLSQHDTGICMTVNCGAVSVKSCARHRCRTSPLPHRAEYPNLRRSRLDDPAGHVHRRPPDAYMGERRPDGRVVPQATPARSTDGRGLTGRHRWADSRGRHQGGGSRAGPPRRGIAGEPPGHGEGRARRAHTGERKHAERAGA